MQPDVTDAGGPAAVGAGAQGICATQDGEASSGADAREHGICPARDGEAGASANAREDGTRPARDGEAAGASGGAGTRAAGLPPGMGQDRPAAVDHRPAHSIVDRRATTLVKKARVRAAAARLLARATIHSVTQEDVSLAAGLTKSSCYYYYGTRDALLADTLTEHLVAIDAAVCGAFDATVNAEAPERITALAHAFLRVVLAQRNAHLALRLNTRLVSDARRPAVIARSRQVTATLRAALLECVPGLEDQPGMAGLLMRQFLGSLSEAVTWFKPDQRVDSLGLARLIASQMLMTAGAVVQGAWVLPPPATPPDMAVDAASPDVAVGAASPGTGMDAASPGMAMGAASPDMAVDAASPGMMLTTSPDRSSGTLPDPRSAIMSNTMPATPPDRLLDASESSPSLGAIRPAGSTVGAAPPHAGTSPEAAGGAPDAMAWGMPGPAPHAGGTIDGVGAASGGGVANGVGAASAGRGGRAPGMAEEPVADPPRDAIWLTPEQARRSLPKLVRAAGGGTEVVLTHRGVPTAKLVPATRERLRMRGIVGGRGT